MPAVGLHGHLSRIKDIPTTYETIYELARSGLTDAQIGKIIGVSEVTINNWKKESEEFSLALKGGKAIADNLVEKALFFRAIGYSHNSEEVKVVSLGNNQGSEVVRLNTVQDYPPDTSACIFWLKNRKSAEWRDKFR